MSVRKRTIVITGTDTGVGKTVLTALLLARLQERGRRVLACKPFSSGARTDARLLAAMQDGILPLERINPFHFSRPLAPAVAAEMSGRKVKLAAALEHLRELRDECDLLLVEGAGGLLSPLGWNYSLLDLIKEMTPDVIIAGSNKLGVLNHFFLTVKTLESIGTPPASLVLTPPPVRDASTRSNAQALQRWLPRFVVTELALLRGDLSATKIVRRHARRLGRKLDFVVGWKTSLLHEG